ncbi:Mur ligase family protein, partial [Parafannyhessea umbonata]|uniref:Mur ligase family protein n=1 Tax=Parafannyhessea umbonata TaxID=604330 RepID=UPI0026E998A9
MDTMTLARIAQLLSTQGLLERVSNMDDASAQTRVTGADCDSRFAAPNHLFVCKGAAFKPAYLASALESGCVGYLCDDAHANELAAVAPDAPQLVASDLRRAMAVASAAAWGHPDRNIDVVGITGTKGKSTVSYMLKQILDAGSSKPRAAILGSIETFDGVEHFESVNTTPESPDLWRHVRNASDSGLPYLVMEVSSQALKYDRVVDLGLDVACFLNIGRDHISPVEHPDFADYFGSKLRIFDQARTAVVNLDTDEL